MKRDRVSALVFTLAAALSTGGCRRGTERAGAEAGADAARTIGSGASSAPAAPPTDHLASGELLEGSRRVFGLALPRDVQVKGAFVDVVYATAPVSASVAALSRYFRARLVGGSMREGPSAATFDHVRAGGGSGPELVIRVAAALGGCSIEIRNATPPPAAPDPDDATRWRRVGLTPEGRLADPTHLE